MIYKKNPKFKFISKLFLSILSFAFVNEASAQFNMNNATVTGNIETVAQYLTSDSSINAFAPDQKAVMNSYANINYSLGNFRAGVRFESYLPVIALIKYLLLPEIFMSSLGVV